MAKTEIYTIYDPSEYFAENAGIMSQLGSNAFGRSSEDFGPSVQSKFQKSSHGQVILDAGQPVGFALYAELGSTLWLRAIAIDQKYQGQGLGVYTVARALEGYTTIAATTRNPATVKLIGSVTRLASPDLRLDDPFQHAQNPLIKEAILNYASAIDADPLTLPYLMGTYPKDLYGLDPGSAMPLDKIALYPENAIMVVGVA
jgi:hypothetical protein